MFDVSNEVKEFLGKPKRRSLERFLKKVHIKTQKDTYSLKSYIKHLKKTKTYRGEGTDPRLTRAFWEEVYDFYYIHWEDLVDEFIAKNFKVADKLIDFEPCVTNLYADDNLRVVRGSAKPSGRLNKSVFWNHIYNTEGSVAKRKLLNDLKDITKCKITSYLIYPSMLKYFNKKDYSGYFMNIRATYPTLSVFNPYTYTNILDNVLHSRKVFCPVLSWGSPAIALAKSTRVEKLVACDVIPEVVEKSRELFEYCNTTDGLFDASVNKKFKAYCCPSEKLDKKHNFSKKYKKHFDTVFFSPPYFDLELYEGGDQSIESYPDYETWLIEYWEKTVETCFNVLKPGGTFSFIIVPFYLSSTEKKRIDISKDLLNIAKKYFQHIDTKSLAWGNFKGKSDSEKRKASSFLEDFHILKRRW